MNTTNTNPATQSSNEEPILKWIAPRAPKFVPLSREDKRAQSDEDLRSIPECRISMGDDEHALYQPFYVTSSVAYVKGIPKEECVKNPFVLRLDQLTHVIGMCDQVSLCLKCGSLRKTLKLMRKIPQRTENIIERYYVCLGMMSMNDFYGRTAQDQLTFTNQTVPMRAQLTRGLKYYKHHLTKDMTTVLRRYMIDDHDKRAHDTNRTNARDFKYAAMHDQETEFHSQGLGPIEHVRGDCEEQYSMCSDCVSVRKCYVIGKISCQRRAAAYGLFHRLLVAMEPPQARQLVVDSKWFIEQCTENAVDWYLTYHYIYAATLGPNFAERSQIRDLHYTRKNYLKQKNSKSEYRYELENPWKAQAIFDVEFKCSSIDRITDMLSNLITSNNIGVDPTEWARRLTSFVLMLIQLCAQSTLLIKMTAVAQFLTHFHFPGLETFHGYARQLAQVFQAAVDRIKGRPDNYRDLHAGLVADDEEDEFHAQVDVPEKTHEGLLVGTAKLLCAMAGITDYDIKVNSARVSKLDQISRTIMSTERLAQFVTRLFKYAYEAASLHIFGIHPDMRELHLVSEKIPAWMDKVSNYYANEGLVRVTKNIQEARQMGEWLKQGDEYNALLWKFKVMPKAYAVFKTAYNQCDRMNQAAAPYLTDSSMRVSPFVIMLTGPPGLGKSTMMYYLITDLMKPSCEQRGIVFKPGEDVHCRNSEGKHWDGYHGQMVVVVDDIFQSMDPASTIQQCMDLCHMKNVVSWPVTKADLNSKGNTFMTSELLMLTGNASVPNDIGKVVRSYGAIRRRIDLMVLVHVLPKYCDQTGKIDRDAVEKNYPAQIVDGLEVAADITDIMRFDVFDNTDRMILSRGTYAQLVRLSLQLKDVEKGRDESIIRANYLHAGLDVYGQVKKEPEFKAQMMRSAVRMLRGDEDKIEVDQYVGDLLFESDVAHVQALCTNNQWFEGASGFLTEEERMEIFTTIEQNVEANPTWSHWMKEVWRKTKDKISERSRSYRDGLGDFVDRTREMMQGHMMTKVGGMVMLAVSILTLGFMAHHFMKGDDGEEDHEEKDDEWQPEVSGDETTRQTKTVMKVAMLGQREVAKRVIHGKTYVASKSTPKSTTWVPEGKIRKPLSVTELLWQDEDECLPKDVMAKQGDDYVAQACPDRNAYNLGINKVTNNAVVATTTLNDRVVAELRGMFVYGRVLLLPLHFFHGLDINNTPIELTNAHGLKMNFNTSECDIKVPPQEMDSVFLRLPKRFQCYVDLRSHFHSEEGLNKGVLREAMLWIIDGENNSKLVTLCDNIQKDTVLDYRVTSFNAKDPEKKVHLVKSYVYHGMTLAGYCGAPLIWLNPSVQTGHILGIHVAGTNLRGLTTPITREFLYAFLREWDDISIRVPPLDVSDGPMIAHAKRGVLREMPLAYYGRVGPKQQVRLPTTTTIMKSPLYGTFEPVTAPALLYPTSTLNPLRTGIMKQCVPLVVFPQKVVDDAMDHLCNAILAQASPFKKEVADHMVLTENEAINGLPGEKWIPPMNLHTSPGYPYVLSDTRRPGKFDFVEGEIGERTLHPVVGHRVRERIEHAQVRRIDMTLFMDILKDERVKLEKVRLGKTRIFNVAPFDLNVAVRMYFQMFAAHLMHNHVYGECAVGLNPHSDEWGLMYHHLKHVGENWIGGDYSNYDKQLSYQLLKAVLTIINRFYDDDASDIRECLFETMFSAFHIAERGVYRVPQGNPSGIVMTSLVNSLVNSLMMRIMYVQLGGNLTTFDDNVRLKTYGDDNIAAVSSQVPWFNMMTISQEFAKFGIVYNRPDKTEICGDMTYLHAEDLTFLKRAFVYQSGRVMAPLDINSIHEMVNWIRESNDDDEATRANFLAACREMHHHGEQEFETFTKHVYRAAQSISLKLPYTDYVASGEFWGAESDDRVNLPTGQTTHPVEQCYGLEDEEVLFSAQSKQAPRKTKAVWPLLCELLIIAAVYNSTSNSKEPNENTASSTVNDENVTTRTEITTFSDSSVVTMTNPQQVPPVPPTPADPYMKQTLTSFLQRVYYDTYTWTPAMAMGTLIQQITFPNFLFSVVPIWDKLKNFTYFRAGVKIGIRMNGSKFHYGQILVSYTPQGNNTLDLAFACNNIYSASGCPSFTIAPSENEVHEFILPYALPYQYIPMYNMTGSGDPAYQFGVLNIYVLNPLANAATPTPVTFTVFANFVDVDIAGYSPVAFTIPNRFTENQTTFPALLPSAPGTASTVPQVDPLLPFAGLTDTEFFAQRATKEQALKSEKGMIGTVAESVSAISGALSFIPEVGIVAAGISAVAGGVATVANYFGWSNPISLRALQPMLRRYANIVNTHGLNDSINLSLHADAIVSPSCELLGGHPREMEMLYVAQTPSMVVAGINWTAAMVPSTTLYDIPITPLAEYADSSNRTYPTLLSWLSKSCLFWRGTLRYHIQITCSQMHVGRMRVSFYPVTRPGGMDMLSDDQLSSVASTIIDIQQQTSMSFSVPYLFEQPWCEMTNLDGVLKPIGWLRFSVLNELNHPNVPVPPIYINVWISAGADFQLSRPDVLHMATNFVLPTSFETEFKAQGLTRDAMRIMPAPPLIPASGSNETAICNADEFHHIKDIFMRPAYVGSVPDVAAGAPSNVLISPWVPMTRVVASANFSDSFSYFRYIYRFMRGGHRTIFNNISGPAEASNTSYSYMANQHTQYAGFIYAIESYVGTGSTIGPANILRVHATAGITHSPDYTYPQTAVTPYYSTLYGFPNAARRATGTPAGSFNNYGTRPDTRLMYVGGGPISIAAADDMELIFLVGPPALYSDGS